MNQHKKESAPLCAVVAVDSFKGSLTSLEAGEAVEEGIKRACPDAKVRVRPLADGGEGTVDALAAGLGGEKRTVRVCGPLGREQAVDCTYGVIGDLAVIDFIEQYPNDRSGYLGFFILSGERHNQGIGQMLLGIVEDTARQCGLSRIELACFASNEPGLRFWKKEGY